MAYWDGMFRGERSFGGELGSGLGRGGFSCLAAGRYISVPMTTADQEATATMMALELMGRPAAGEYSLTLYPDYGFDGGLRQDVEQIQDIQLIFELHYWSRQRAGQ